MDDKTKRAILKEFDFRVRRIAAVVAVKDYGVVVPENRYQVIWGADDTARLILDIATMEEPIMEIPADWWQHFKQRWFRGWLTRKFPVKTKWIGAEHKFPELSIPDSLLGKEFVHLAIINPQKESPS
uniref:Uncharacterized protein n=1 Tax=viral metagenome TaxID=1070528 RepID=A0A6M3K1Z7_9ZZZZ